MIIDVSHHNQNIDWQKVKDAGVTRAYIKCTNGSHGLDPMYKTNLAQAQAVGIETGAYHFLLSGQNPNDQVNNFLVNIDGVDLHPVIDIEWDLKNAVDRWLNVPTASRVAMLGRFIKILKANYPSVMIYTNIGWWKRMIGTNNSYEDIIFSDCELWVADYTTAPDNVLNINGWKPIMRQYSEKGKIAGINGPVDLNRMI